MPTSNKLKLARAISKALHAHGEPLNDGRMAIDVNAAVDALLALGVLRAPTDDESNDDGDDGDDSDQDETDPAEVGRAQGRAARLARERIDGLAKR
jgi:hypothetical protein